MRRLLICVLLVLAGCAPARPVAPPPAERMLFVGNSLTYVGNLPAVYAALSSANGRPARARMIVEGGATLSERLADGSIERALSAGGYRVLVMQERGGDLLCADSSPRCAASRRTIARLSRLAESKGANAVLLGTYQPNARASLALVEAERSAAADAGIPYIEISETFRSLRGTAPDAAWFAADGMHPGSALTLLNAVLVYRALNAELPKIESLAVAAPIYASSSGLTADLRDADAPPPRADTPTGIVYSADELRMVVGAVRRDE